MSPPSWSFFAEIGAVVKGNITLGVAMGHCRCIADQLLAKVGVIRALHERAQLCQDPQTEFALTRESSGVSRIKHIFSVHGHTILTKEAAAKTFDEVAHGAQQATHSAGQAGIGCKKVS